MSLDLQDLSILDPGGRRLFAPLSLRVGPGEVATVMGPSGIGKSTLLEAIGGHLAHGFRLSGRITLAGRDMAPLPAEARRIGLVFQDALLFAHLSLGDNLAFGLAPSPQGRAQRRAQVETALQQAGLAGLAHRDPATLSGGQRARAALMRSLLAAPLALLLDEPFARLDSDLRAEMRGFVLGQIQSRGIPALLVTHDPQDAQAARLATGGPVIRLKA